MGNTQMLRTLKFAVAVLAVAADHPVAAQERWQTFREPRPGWVNAAKEKGCLRVGKAHMFYAVFGAGEPVLLIHGGLGNADVWEDQVKALASKHMVIVADSRGHGRSTRSGNDVHYRVMADDYIALLDHLKLAKVAIAGWSDGGVIGLDLAMRHGARVSRLFAHAANSKPGVAPSGRSRAAWNAYATWARASYAALAKTRCDGLGARARGFQDLSAASGVMWRTEPNWPDADLKKIGVPTTIVLGDRDEAISCRHTQYLAKTIPGAKLWVLPAVSHFALRQDAMTYNAALLHFLGDGPAPKLGSCTP